MGGQVGECACGDLSAMVAQCNPALVQGSLGEYFAELLYRHDVQKLQIIERAGLDRSYGYQIFRGVRRASRDTYVKISIVMQLPLDEVQEMLSVTQTGVLYAKHARDLVLRFCIERRYPLVETNHTLMQLGYQTLR